MDYLEYDYFTKIVTVRQRPMVFPAVTLCFEEYQWANQYFDIAFDRQTVLLTDFEQVNVTDDDGYILMCYKFNGGRNSLGESIELKQASRNEFIEGLWMDIYIEEGPKEFKLFVGDNRHMPVYQELTTNLELGLRHTVSFEKTVEVKLGQPYNDCIEDLSSYNSGFVNFDYRRENCLQLCSQEHIVKKCNCTLEDIWSNKDSMFYDFNDYSKPMQCYKTEWAKYEFKEKCFDKCPLECNSIYYKVNAMSRSHSPSVKRFQTVIDSYAERYNLTEEDATYYVKKRATEMFVNFKELKYTEITQEPKLILADFIAGLGGTLGLFLGVSILSFAEIVEVFIRIILLAKSNRDKVKDSAI